MYDTVVAIDLETTGADPYTDRIIEVGAAIWHREGGIGETFSELAGGVESLSPGIIKLTGIHPEMLRDARSLDAVLSDFLDFLPPKALCIAHNAAFERAFLRAATKDRFRHKVLDTVELSRISFPDLPSHSLQVLAELLELPRGEDHRALGDCETLLALWERILARVGEIPLPVVSEMVYLLQANARHPYRDFFQRLEAEGLARSFGETPPKLESIYTAAASLAPPERPAPAEPEETAPLDEDAVAEHFEAGGSFARVMPAHEPREGQVQMARAFAQALNGRQHLLVEAGTGIGKSLAYLVPAVLWATTNRAPVVVSTNTKNLQAQLHAKDIPLVRDALGIEFRAAILKGRRNYLCLRKLFYVLRQAQHELDVEERMRLLNVLPWSAWTKTGDISENIVWDRPGFAGVWLKLSTVGDECLGRACPQARRCFLRRARAAAQAADLIVANHSLVFAELNVESPALPPYRHLVFDEAHNLEDAATHHLSVEVSPPRLGIVLGRLERSGRRKKQAGLLPSIEASLGSAEGLPPDLAELALRHIETARCELALVSTAQKEFFDALRTVLESRRDTDTYRFQADRKPAKTWEPVTRTQEALLGALAGVMRAAEALQDALREAPTGSLRYQREFTRDLAAAVQWIREITQDIAFVLAGENEGYVYWIERAPGRAGGIRAWAAPRSVGHLLYDQVYTRKDTVLFSSATMSVRNSFAFLKRRLGIDLVPAERLLELDAGTPFDYETQCRVFAPTFLPEPGDSGKDYAAELAVLLSEIVRRAGGRTLALFTSHRMLRESAETLNAELLGDGIQVLAQGLSGSRENITTSFKRGERSVLLGTHSFWEGVDVVGEALSCLTITRLPFQVFTDPIVAARCEQVEAEGENAFIGYSLPSAVIRFRQGFGRLIRHRTDRGVAIVTDRRMIAKRYGEWFRKSLPARVEVFNDREELLDAIEDFLVPGDTETSDAPGG